MLPLFISLTQGMKKGERDTLIRHSMIVALFVGVVAYSMISGILSSVNALRAH
jgi:small neutral amino acid transporter SnatA (MarC family)